MNQHNSMLVSLLWLMILAALPVFATEYRIYDTGSKKTLSLDELVESLDRFDVVFFGEHHDDSLHHALEAQIFMGMHRRNPNVALSMEMFERDVQAVLDTYLHGFIGEDEFLERSSPWGNYQTDYRPLVEYAREQRLPVIAANVPRWIASRLHKFGNLNGIKPIDRRLFKADHLSPGGAYRDKFYATMRVNMGIMSDSLSPARKKVFRQMYQAQCLKDATMAESIQRFLEKEPDRRVFHVNGTFHSATCLGTVEQLKRMNPDLSVAVISPVEVPSEEELRFTPEMASEGTFVVVKHQEKKTEPRVVLPHENPCLAATLAADAIVILPDDESIDGRLHKTMLMFRSEGYHPEVLETSAVPVDWLQKDVVLAARQPLGAGWSTLVDSLPFGIRLLDRGFIIGENRYETADRMLICSWRNEAGLNRTLILWSGQETGSMMSLFRYRYEACVILDINRMDEPLERIEGNDGD